MITSNHVHLWIKDTGPNVIADSMQLIAGRTAQEYNHRKDRQGAFWEDRYHATRLFTAVYCRLSRTFFLAPCSSDMAELANSQLCAHLL
jgi:REP element-mobilizing transposase RayT